MPFYRLPPCRGARVRRSKALEQGAIPADRWASYARLQREARHHALEADSHAQRAEKQTWKAIHKAARRMYRDRGR